MITARKIVLVSESDYLPRHDDLLRDLINRPLDADRQLGLIFYAVGKESRKFKEAVERLFREMFPDRFIVTSSHPSLTEADALAEAKKSFKEHGEDVEVVRV